MSEMVERLARAIWEVRRQKAALISVHLEEWGDGKIPRLNHVFDEARAAIEAIREPTKDMMDEPTWYDGPYSQFAPDDAKEVWQQMIDVALK